MNRAILFLLFALLSNYSCTNSKSEIEQDTRVKDELEQLTTSELREAYLSDLFSADQKLRNDSFNAIKMNLIGTYGWNSEEHLRLVELRKTKDATIFKRLAGYVDTYGYTDETASFGWQARSAFPYITGHNSSKTNSIGMLELLIPASKKGLVPMKDIVWIMAEYYESQNGQIYEVGWQPYTIQDEYDGLISVLDLEDLFID